jgi:putative DNA primase/helicase
MTEVVDVFDFVIAYAARGWHVLPLHSVRGGRCTCGRSDCTSPGKHPRTPHGGNDATTDLNQLAEWYERWPDANVGVATGRKSGLVVLDVDPKHGGEETLLTLEGLHGKLPTTLEVITGSGGRHLYFRYPAGVPYLKSTAGVLGPGLDVRADGGYVVAPPSNHVSGRPYLWEASSNPEVDEPADLPGWLLNLLTAGRPSGNGHKQHTDGKVPQGQRNTWLTREAGKMRRAGLEEAAITAALLTLNREHCDPPLDEVEVRRIAQSICRYAPGYPLTDAGNAEFFADRYAGQVCYRHDLRRWFVWNPPVWRPDDIGVVERLALEAVRERQAQALGIQDADLRKKALTFLLASESAYRLHSMLAIAENLDEVAKTGREFDRNPLLLAVKNGVIDLTTGEFREGQPGDFITQVAGTDFDPTASAPRWAQFLEEVFLGDRDLIGFVQRAVGYCLTGLTREQVFFFCYGTGRNGKSTLFDVLRAMFGDYAKNAAFSTFAQRRDGGGHQDDLMALEGVRLVTASESKAVGTIAEDVLKTIAGSDPITGSRKHEKTRTFQPTFKVWLAANNLPKVQDVSDGFWRKVILVPFRARFEGAVEDKRLGEKLKTELPGILNWALEGCLAYQREGLNPPQRCIDAVAAWRADNDPLADFLTTCRVGDGLEVRASDLYQAYERFCAQNGQKAISMTAFSQLVQAHGFVKEKRRGGRFFMGIGL